MDALSAYLGFGLGLLAPGDTGGDEKESKSTKLYLPERTLSAANTLTQTRSVKSLVGRLLELFLELLEASISIERTLELGLALVTNPAPPGPQPVI